MKRMAFLSLMLVFTAFTFAQNTTTNSEIIPETTPSDTIVPWTGNLIGLNVYPAFGVIGGGILPASKMFIQYRRMYEKFNVRASLNYINYYNNNNRLDIVGVNDTMMIFREFDNNFYTFDVRAGGEYAFHVDKFRFFLGGGAIVGYHNYEKMYYHYGKKLTDYPMENIVSPLINDILGQYQADMLKLGVDFTIGADVLLSENVVLTVQYAPEIAYYKRMASHKNDPENIFLGDVDNFSTFRPDFIDIVLSIGF